MGEIIAKSGKTTTYDDAIKELLKRAEGESKPPRRIFPEICIRKIACNLVINTKPFY